MLTAATLTQGLGTPSGVLPPPFPGELPPTPAPSTPSERLDSFHIKAACNFPESYLLTRPRITVTPFPLLPASRVDELFLHSPRGTDFWRSQFGLGVGAGA